MPPLLHLQTLRNRRDRGDDAGEDELARGRERKPAPDAPEVTIEGEELKEEELVDQDDDLVEELDADGRLGV